MAETTLTHTPHPGGRPTKYNETYVQKANEFFEKHYREQKMPWKQQLAFELDLNQETISDWAEKYEEFSVVIKKIEELQQMFLMHGGLANKVNTTMAIFLLKAKHGLREADANQQQGYGQPIQFNITSGGYIPPVGVNVPTPDADIVQPQALQGTSVAQTSPQNINSNNGVNTAGTA